MQTPNLPIQVNSAGPAPQAARAKNGASEGSGQFSQALSREIEGRKSPMIPPAAPQAQPKPAAAAKPQGGQPPQHAQQAQSAKPADKAAAAPKSAAAEKSPGKASEKTETADSAAADGAAAAAAAAADASQGAVPNPVVDMLNLVASFNQPAAAAAPADSAADIAAAAAADPLLAAGGKRARLELPVDGAPAALPAAVKSLIAGQAVADTPAPAAEAPAAPFANMMARADGSMLDDLKNAAQSGKDAVTTERAAPQASSERAVPGKPEAALGLPDQIKGAADAAPMASLRARDVAAEPSALKDLQVSAPATAPLQQAALQVAQAVNGLAAGDKIPARVGTPAWDNQVAQKIVWMVGGEEQSASLTLNPPDLGPMQVVLSVTNDMASVTFSSNQLEVRQALEDAMPKLREMMSENGIALGNASVNDGSAEQQQAQEQSTRRGGGAQQADNGPTNGSAAEAEARNNARPQRVGQTVGMVDTFA